MSQLGPEEHLQDFFSALIYWSWVEKWEHVSVAGRQRWRKTELINKDGEKRDNRQKNGSLLFSVLRLCPIYPSAFDHLWVACWMLFLTYRHM